MRLMASEYSLSIILILQLFCSRLVLAYDEEVAHPRMTERAINVANLDLYLKTQFAAQFVSGITTLINGRPVIDIIARGSKDEDTPVCRASNHFHNPLQSWEKAGITSILRPLCPTWDETPAGTRYSALTWVTGYEKSGGPVISRSKQEMGWDKARDYFYLALTSKDIAVRDDNFAKTFQAVGQVMHLLQDMAVPAHVRNDFWNSHIWTGGMNPYELYVLNHPDLIASLTDTQINNVKPIMTSRRHTALWDTSDGCADVPAQIGDASIRPQAGLAEYTNANFVSEGTLFSGPTASCPSISSGFQYPTKTATQLVHTVADPFKPGATVKRPYYYRPQNSQDWESDYRLAGVNYTYFYEPNSISPDKIVPPLDDYVHRDYAVRLLPRAIGFSAALLDYFFRGTLEIAIPGTQIFGIADGSQAPFIDPSSGRYHQQFTKIRARIKNTTPNEALVIGKLQAVAKYKIIPDYAADLSTYPSRSTMAGVQYSYSVSDTIDVASISSGSIVEQAFNFGLNPIPAGITDLSLQVVFKGTIGQEMDTAIAVGYKDLSEPTHMVFWNLTDLFSYGTPCFNNPSLICYGMLTSKQIDSNPDIKTTLTTRRIDYYPSTLYMKFAFSDRAPAGPINSIAEAIVPAGGHVRLIVLTDGQGATVNYVHYAEQINTLFWDVFTGARVATRSNAPIDASPVTTFRYSGTAGNPVPFIQHYDYEIIDCYPPLSDGSCAIDASVYSQPANFAGPTPVTVQITMP